MNKNVSTEICEKCAECCKNYPLVELSKDEINVLEKFTGYQIGLLINSKNTEDEKFFLKFKENGDCFFLNENNGRYSCDVYEARPEICKNYPSTPRQHEACCSNREKS